MRCASGSRTPGTKQSGCGAAGCSSRPWSWRRRTTRASSATTTWRPSTAMSRFAARRRRRGPRRRTASPSRAASSASSATGRGAWTASSRGCGPPRRATTTRRGADSSRGAPRVGRLRNVSVNKHNPSSKQPLGGLRGLVLAACKTLARANPSALTSRRSLLPRTCGRTLKSRLSRLVGAGFEPGG